MTKVRLWIFLLIVAGLVIGAASTLVQIGPRGPRVRLQLPAPPSAQFAGYLAAVEKGFYEQEGLAVTILPGKSEAAPAQVVAGGRAEVGVDRLPRLLTARDRGSLLVNIAQIFARSGLRQVSFKASGIATPADYRGKKIAVWFGGREFALLATLEKYGLDRNRDVTLVQQPPDVTLLLKQEVAAASAMIYDEYRHVLEAGAGAHDLVVIDFEREGTALLEDGLFVREEWLADEKQKAIAVRFLRASLRGWEFCRDAPSECVGIVLRGDHTLDARHQAWMMAQVNRLIWGPPAPAVPAGRMDPEAFARTARILLRYGSLGRPPGAGAYTDEIWELATRTP